MGVLNKYRRRFVGWKDEEVPKAERGAYTYSTFSPELVDQYVCGKLVIVLEELYDYLFKWAELVGPIFASVIARLDVLDRKTFKEIDADEIIANLTASKRDIALGIEDYNDTIGRIERDLETVTTTTNLPQFLEENGVPEKELKYFVQLLREKWDVTYGMEVANLREILNLVHEARSRLIVQQKIVVRIEQDNYILALRENKELDQLFEEEHAIFWDVVHKLKIGDERISKIEALLKTAMEKLKYQVNAFVKVKKITNSEDFAKCRGDLENAVMVLSYLNYAFAFALNRKEQAVGMFETGARAAIKKLNKDRKLCHAIDRLLDSSFKVISAAV
jgi:hypothetical protein